MSANHKHLVIVGGGIGGMALALASLRRGIDVDLYEQAAALGEVGAGFQVSENGLKCLVDLGLGERIEELGTGARGKEVRLWSTGESWAFQPSRTAGADRADYYLFYRPDLHSLLVEETRRLKPDAIHLGAKVNDVTGNAEGASITLVNGEQVSGAAVVGADGVHSAVRKSLFGPGSANFTGCMAWRGLIPIERVPAALRVKAAVNWMGPGAHVIFYPLRHGQLYNFVGIVERADWKVESWTVQGTAEECARDFLGWNEDVQSLIKQLDRPNKWALLSRPPMQTWTSGRATLLGDACHPTLPFLAQGAVMALEDAVVLSRCIEAFPGDWEQAFKRYVELRLERTARIVRESSENQRRFHNSALADVNTARAFIESEWSPNRLGERHEWLHHYDPTTLPVRAQ